MTLPVLLSSFLVMILQIVSLIGCLTVGLLAFVLPPLFHWKLVSSSGTCSDEVPPLNKHIELTSLTSSSSSSSSGKYNRLDGGGAVDNSSGVGVSSGNENAPTIRGSSSLLYWRDALLLGIGSAFVVYTTYKTYLDVESKLAAGTC